MADIYGRRWLAADLPPEVEGMHDPVRCNRCRTGVYDLGTVDVTGHYVDCSMWKAPCCGALVDDRGETGWKSFKDYTRLGEGQTQ